MGQWQTLEAHSANVATLAATFAEPFGSAEFARLLGSIHDAGKARDSFQAYLMRANGIDDREYDGGEHCHSGAGACWAVSSHGLPWGIGRILAYCVAGHHAGLPDWMNGDTPNGALGTRLKAECQVLGEKSLTEWISKYEKEWRTSCPKALPECFPSDMLCTCKEGTFENSTLSFWIRMLYSCLVDADFLDTEAFIDQERAKNRAGYLSLQELSERFVQKLDAKQASSPNSPVNRIRARIRKVCEIAAEKEPGLFTLTVPTGGGKTLSSTAFAFRHALRYGKKRIIYVIPYTSIIEQTADVLREFLGSENVLEHHTNFDPGKETPRSRLASEDWDAPIVVTTSVQFFESLYAAKSSRCRKLHNIADSVVILDEVQLLPTHLLLPSLEAIRQLAKYYGTTVVLSTATQPRFPGFSIAKDREMIPASFDLYGRLKRMEIEWPADFGIRRDWRELAAELRENRQVLCVVNTRKDCRELFEQMPEGTVHLSALMCGEHRSRVIRQIKDALSRGDPIRVISTQLVEAGVDFDFPVVYRAFTGLASVAQAAGRCNREGRLEGNGRVVVFMPPSSSPRGELRKGEDALRELLECWPMESVNSPAGYGEYFEGLYRRMNELGASFRDYFVARAKRCEFQFREGAAAFQMIDDQASCPVIVRYGGNDDLIESLRLVGPRRAIMRRLQRYVVQVPRNIIPVLLNKGFVEKMHDDIVVQTQPSLYSEVFGLDLFREGLREEELVL